MADTGGSMSSEPQTPAPRPQTEAGRDYVDTMFGRKPGNVTLTEAKMVAWVRRIEADARSLTEAGAPDPREVEVPARQLLAIIVMDALNEHGKSYRLPRDPSDLAYAVADALLAHGVREARSSHSDASADPPRWTQPCAHERAMAATKCGRHLPPWGRRR